MRARRMREIEQATRTSHASGSALKVARGSASRTRTNTGNSPGAVGPDGRPIEHRDPRRCSDVGSIRGSLNGRFCPAGTQVTGQRATRSRMIAVVPGQPVGVVQICLHVRGNGRSVRDASHGSAQDRGPPVLQYRSVWERTPNPVAWFFCCSLERKHARRRLQSQRAVSEDLLQLLAVSRCYAVFHYALTRRSRIG
jgi:hypothetical protein